MQCIHVFTDVCHFLQEVGAILPLCVKQITPNVKAMEIADLGVCLFYACVKPMQSVFAMVLSLVRSLAI